MLWYEAVAQLKAGQILSAKGRSRWSSQRAAVRLQYLPDHGWVLEDQTRSPEDGLLSNFERLELALLEFERRVGAYGLHQSVSDNRYAHLFPTGSSLGWSPKPLDTWRPRPLPSELYVVVRHSRVAS